MEKGMGNAVALPSRPRTDVGLSVSGNGVTFAPSSMMEVLEFAKLMADAGPLVPKHCRQQPGVCLGITLQALRWGYDPFAVASKSFLVNDRIAYEAQLIAAVVNTNAPIRGRLVISYTGDGQTRQCHVVGDFSDGGARPYTSPRTGMIKPKNSPLWISDPDQQLAYYSIRAWARRWVPEVLLGVYDREEVEEIVRQEAQGVESQQAAALVFVDGDEEDVPDAIDPSLPLVVRFSESLKRCRNRDEVAAVWMAYDTEINAVEVSAREPLRQLYGAALKMVKGDLDLADFEKLLESMQPMPAEAVQDDAGDVGEGEATE